MWSNIASILETVLCTLRKMYILLLLGGVFCLCLLGPIDIIGCWSSDSVFLLIFCLVVLLIHCESKLLKSPNIIVGSSISPFNSFSVTSYIFGPWCLVPGCLVTPSWWGESYQYIMSFVLLTVFYLKSVLSDLNIVTLALFRLMFEIPFSPFHFQPVCVFRSRVSVSYNV